MAKPAAVSPNIRCATANIQSVNPSAASSSSLYQTIHCMIGHTAAMNRIPAASTTDRLPGSRSAIAAIAVPKMLATVMCTASPMSAAGTLKVALSGADL